MSQQINSTVSNLTPGAAASDVGQLDFIIRAIMSGYRTATPVKVISCTNNGGLSPIGYVTVQPLVNTIDGSGVSIPHGEIANVPYMRIQGGINAIILDPEAGDIGMASISDRDISSVKASLSASAPGSNRKNSFSDMMYHGTIISKTTPTQFIQFNSTGITVTSPHAVNINAANATVTASANAAITAPVINIGASSQTLQALVTAAFKTLYNAHTHASGGSGPPNVPMTTSQLTTTIQGG